MGINGAPCGGGKVRLQAADGRFHRSNGHEGAPPSWTGEKCEESVWTLLFDGDHLNDATWVQLKAPQSGYLDDHFCLCNDTPTGGWGGAVKGMYSWCPEGRGDAFWNLHGLVATDQPVADGKSVVEPVIDTAASRPNLRPAPRELHKIVKKLRVELGMPNDLPMAQAVDRAVANLGLHFGEGAGLLQKAETAWKAFDA